MRKWTRLSISLACIYLAANATPAAFAGESLNSASGGASGFYGASYMTNPNISLVLDTRAYASNLSNEQLAERGIPGYTAEGLEMQKGFRLEEAELTFFAPVDPFFNLYANIPVSTEGVELEEAYAVSTALPAGLQLKLGRFKSGITRLDAQHPHAWDFADLALPYRAFMGSEGLGGENGVQVTYLPGLPFYLLIGAEALQGENSLILGGNEWAGPQAFTGFMKTSLDTSDLSTLYFGPWFLTGRTRTEAVVADQVLTGRSTLGGLEAVWKWNPDPSHGLIVQGEYMLLHQEGKLEDADANHLGGTVRTQDGAYIQSVYRWYQFRAGVRYDRLALARDHFTIHPEGEDAGDVRQDLGFNPWRASASLEYNPDEFTRIRLQYTRDESARSGIVNHEGLLQFIFGIGAHAAHTF